jgi:hypothetical protein
MAMNIVIGKTKPPLETYADGGRRLGDFKIHFAVLLPL